jgi:acetyl esterase/lipase
MVSEQAKNIKSLIQQFVSQIFGDNPTLESIRAGAESVASLTADPAGVVFSHVQIGGIRAQWVDTPGADKDCVLLFLHGGGYIMGSSDSHRKLVGHITAAAGCRGLAIDYRLAPEHPHPSALEDCVAAYRWLLEQPFTGPGIAVCGDSAGGALAIALLLAIRDADLPTPAGSALLSPWVDLELMGESMTSKAEVDLMVSAKSLRGMAEMYLAGQNPRSPYVAPLWADLAGLPNVYIQVGGDETLLDDSTRLVTRLAAAGNAVRLDVFPEMPHVFQIHAGNLPEADDAIERLGMFLKSCFARDAIKSKSRAT